MVVNGRPELAGELQRAPKALVSFVRREFGELLSLSDFADIVLGFCRTDGRQQLLLARIKQMAGE